MANAYSKRLAWKGQAILAGALLVMGVFVYWLEFKHKPKQDTVEELGRKIFPLKDRQIKSISWSDPKGPLASFAFSCLDLASNQCKPGDNSKWQVETPLKVKADDSNVGSLISTFNNLASNEVIDLKDEKPTRREALLKEYGLDAATRKSGKMRIMKVQTDGGDWVGYFGNSHPIGDSMFALGEKNNQTDETRVYVLPSYFKTQFEHDLTYWRDKKILTLAPHEITGITLSGGKSPVSLTRKDGQWVVNSKGEELPGDLDTADGILNGLSYLAAKSFPPKQALKGTRASLSIHLKREGKDETVVTFFEKGDLKKNTGKLFLTVSGLDPVFEVDPYTKDRFNKDITSLRQTKLITSLDRFSARRIELVSKSLGTVVLMSKDGKWSFEAAKDEVQQDRITSLLDKLSGNRVKEFLANGPAPADDALTIQVGDEKTPAKRKMAFWKAGGKIYARDLTSSRKETLVLDTALEPDLPWTRAALLKTSSPAAAPH